MQTGNGNGHTNVWQQWQQAWIDEAMAGMQRWARVPKLYERAQRVKKGASPSEVVYEEDHLRVLHYKTDAPVRYKTPLIFVFALVNRPYILDLKEGKSVVSHFYNSGFDTYLIDWGIPTDADRHLTLDDYINGYMGRVIENIRERTGSKQASLLGYCMGGAMSAMFSSLHPEMIKNLIMLAAGVDFSDKTPLLSMWSDPAVFDVDKFVDAFGNCPAEFLQAGFLMLKPVQNFIEKPINFVEKLDDDRFIDDYFAMEGWLNDNIPVPGEVFRQYIKYMYQQNRLVKGTMPVGKHIVNLRNIVCPILNLMASKDDLVPTCQSRSFNDMVGSQDRKTIEFSAGHIGMAVGSRAQKELWPQACEWLAARSEPLKAASPVAAGAGKA